MNRAAHLLFLASVLATSLARADEPSAAEIALARRLFAEARTAEAASEWKGALAKLREAISIKETPGLRFHMAYSEEQLGMLVEALIDYDRAEEALNAGAKGDDVLRQLGPRRDALRKRVPTVTLTVPPDAHAPSLSLDGHGLPETAMARPIPVNPGHHHVVVSAPGRRAFERDLNLSEGDSAVVVADLPLVALGVVPKPTAHLPPPSRSSAQPVAPAFAASSGWTPRTYVLLGETLVTVAAAAVAGGFLLVAHAADERADEMAAQLPRRDACVPDTQKTGLEEASCNSLRDALDAGQRDRSYAIGGFIGSGIGLAALGATFVLWPAEAVRTRALRFAPLVQAGASGLVAVGQF